MKRGLKLAMSVFFIAGLAGFISCIGKNNQNKTIQVFFDRNIPQHVFAANDIKLALEDRNFMVGFKDLALLEEYKGEKVVIALGADESIASLMISEGGAKLPEMGEQAYALRTTASQDLSYWVFGGDVNGAMYGGLQIAENITFNGLDANYNEEDSPYLKNRGIKFNIPLDKESPTYFYGHHGDAHKLAIKHVWDMDFWKTWFDEMARHRYNVLSLWSPHPFTSMVNMEDDYPGIAINGVIGFDEEGNEVQVNDMTIDEKIEFWREIMKYGKERGFDTYFCNWNVFLSTAEGKHGLTHSTTNERTKAYLKKCMIEFLETYPDLAGFGITVGERMGDLDYKQKEEWAWDTYGMGMMEYAQENPERDLVFIHRQHDGNIDHILEHFAQLNDLSNVKFELSCKYSEAHAHSTVTPSRWHITGMENGLSKYGITSWLTIRNDDFYFLHWAEPQFVRDYINGFPEIDKFVTAFYIGADGWVFTREFTSKNPYYENKDALSIQRTWYMQKLWGRISYNPSISDEFFKNHLAAKFPGISAGKLFEAWSSASESIRLANEQVTGKWKFDNDFWIEMWTGDTWHGGRNRHFTIEDTKEATPFAGSHLCALYNTAKGECGDNTPAWENVEEIDERASNALDILETLNPGSDTELQLTLKDLTAQANLGLYNAYKYRTVMFDIQNKNDEARESMAKAYCYWRNYTDIMSELYTAVEMQRNKSFSSWHDYDDDVLLEYNKLGGVEKPDCITE